MWVYDTIKLNEQKIGKNIKKFLIHTFIRLGSSRGVFKNILGGIGIKSFKVIRFNMEYLKNLKKDFGIF